MVDDVRDITETAESKAASQEVLDRARLARERREAEQRKRLDELRAHAAAAQAQREKRDEERRKRQAEQRARDDDRRVQVEERKRAIWEASVSRREALLQRERDRTERLERQRAARSAPRPAFAFGSSTPRLLEPLDSSGFFWAARSTNPIDQMNFFESLAASTTNVMFASAPLTRRASALHLDSDTDNKDEADRTPPPALWSSVARRRTDLVPTMPAPRAPGRAYSMTRLDRIPHTPHLSRTQTRSGETTPGSRPGSALSNATGVIRRQTVTRKPRPASIAGTGVNTPRGGVGDAMSQSVATTPCVSRDSTVVADVPRRTAPPRRPRPLSLHASPKPAPVTPSAPGDGKPPLHRKPKPSKEHDKTPRGKSLSASPGRALSPSPTRPKDRPHKEPPKAEASSDSNAHAAAVTHKLEALQQTIETQEIVTKTEEPTEKPTADKQDDTQNVLEKPITKEITEENHVEAKEISTEVKEEKSTEVREEKQAVVREEKEVDEKKEAKAEKKQEEKRDEKKEPSVEKTDDSEMTASMSRRITTEEQAKAALAERRRRAREELERQAEIERQRLQREAEEEAERQRLEEERQLREEQEARELALLQRQIEEEKLRKAIEAQQQLEREEAERKAREELERQAKLKEEEEKRVAAEQAEKLRREEKEREEKERLARKQRVEAIMARTRIRKAEEDKKQQESKQALPNAPDTDGAATTIEATATATATTVTNNGKDNGNVTVGDLLGFTSQAESDKPADQAEIGAGDAHNNGNHRHPSLPHESEDKPSEPTKQDTQETNNGNANPLSVSANFIQNEVANNEAAPPQKLPEKIIDDDFTTHNGHNLNHPLTLQNAI